MRIAVCDDNPKDLARMVRLLEEMRAARWSAPTAESGILGMGRGRSPVSPERSELCEAKWLQVCAPDCGPHFEIFAFDHPDALLRAAEKEPFDLYLLDVLMDMLTGVQLVGELKAFQPNPRAIFFSTSTEYAYEAIQMDAVTYVAKPFSDQAFFNAMDKALGRLEEDEREYFALGTEGHIRRFRASDIEYVTTADTRNYVRLHLADGETVDARTSLSAFAEAYRNHLTLTPIGRALLVNPARVKSLDGTRVTFFSGRALEVPRRALPALREAILACSVG